VRKKRRKRGDLIVSHLILFIYPLTLSLFVNVIKRYELVAGIGLGQFAPGRLNRRQESTCLKAGSKLVGLEPR
jgi:hypothetical protein